MTGNFTESLEPGRVLSTVPPESSSLDGRRRTPARCAWPLCDRDPQNRKHCDEHAERILDMRNDDEDTSC